MERTFAWLSRNRRLAKDYERRVQTSDTPSRHTVVECQRFSSGVCTWRLIG
jgi:hypothetical protein